MFIPCHPRSPVDLYFSRQADPVEEVITRLQTCTQQYDAHMFFDPITCDEVSGNIEHY